MFAVSTASSSEFVHVTAAGNDWQTIDVSGSEHNWLNTLWVEKDRFVGSTAYQCCFGELGGPSYGRTVSSDGLSWTHTTNTTASMFENLPAQPTPRTVAPVCTQAADGVLLLAGEGGILSSADALTWGSVLSLPP